MTTKELLEFIFAACGALGSIATVWALIKLYQKDQDKQKQIDRLTDMVEKLTGISQALEEQRKQDKDNTRVQFLPLLKLPKD